MRIGMVLDQEFPPDLRVENEAVTLVNAGYEVFLLCFTYDKNLPTVTTYKNFQLVRIYKNHKIAKKGRALINTILDFYSLYWIRKIRHFVKEYQIDILHIHDLYLLGAGLKVKKKFDLPIVSDLHENYVEGLKKYRFANTMPGKLLISIKKWEKTEIKWISSADKVITVIEEAVDRYAKLGLERKNIFVVPNYVKIDEFNIDNIDPTIKKKFKGKVNLLYIGKFDIHRGLESVIKSLPVLIHEISNIQLILVGNGSNQESMTKLAKNLNVSDYIIFEGFQPINKFPSYIAASQICLIPHLKTVHTDNTIPHKLFHYMIMGKPVVASDCNPIKRIITEANCGIIYLSNDHNDLARSIIYLYSKRDKMKQMGQNGKKAVLEKYNWENTSKNLIKLYKIIENSIRHR